MFNINKGENHDGFKMRECQNTRGVKGYFGLGLSPTTPTPRGPCPVPLPGQEGSSKLDWEVTSTGSSSSLLEPRLLWERSVPPLEQDTGSSAEVKQHKSTSGKKRPELKIHSSNLEVNPYAEMLRQTGTWSGRMLVREISIEYRRRYSLYTKI